MNEFMAEHFDGDPTPEDRLTIYGAMLRGALACREAVASETTTISVKKRINEAAMAFIAKHLDDPTPEQCVMILSAELTGALTVAGAGARGSGASSSYAA